MTENLTRDDVVNMLREQVKLCGYSQKTVAFNLGISPSYLSEILKYTREPGPKVLRVLGLRRESVYTVRVVTFESEKD